MWSCLRSHHRVSMYLLSYVIYGLSRSTKYPISSVSWRHCAVNFITFSRHRRLYSSVEIYFSDSWLSMSFLVIPSSFSTPSSTGSPCVSHPALRCTWKPCMVLYRLKASLIERARTWCMPGWPLADGGPSKKMNWGIPSRSSTLLRKISFCCHSDNISLLVSTKFNPLYSANFLAISLFIFV